MARTYVHKPFKVTKDPRSFQRPKGIQNIKRQENRRVRRDRSYLQWEDYTAPRPQPVSSIVWNFW